MHPWQQIRANDYHVIGLDRKVLLFGSTLLSLLALASIAVLIGGRMAEQTRRVGLLKAVGATPSLVALVLLAESLALALGAAILGILAGDLLTPLLASPGQGLLRSANAPTLTAPAVAIVIGVAAAVAAAATLSPAIRGARTSTVRALNNPANPPRRRPRLIAISAALPVPLLLGLRLIARRTRRTVLSAASLMVAVAMVVAALTVRSPPDRRSAASRIGASPTSRLRGHIEFDSCGEVSARGPTSPGPPFACSVRFRRGRFS